MTTAREVAVRAGVSASTVCRVLSGDPRISTVTQKAVKAAVRSCNYRVNHSARNLKTKKSFSVGLIVPELVNDFFMQIASGIENELRKNGYTLMICSAEENRECEKERIDFLTGRGIDGLIIIPSGNSPLPYRRLLQEKLPFVFVDRTVQKIKAHAVLVDNTEASYRAVSHLLSTGARRIAYIGGNLSLTTAQERYKGFFSAVNDHSVSVPDEYIKTGDFHSESGYRLMDALLSLPELPEYVFITNYFMHIGAAKRILEKYGKKTSPVLIAGFDDMELSSLLGNTVVTVIQPVAELGKKAASILMEILSQPEKKKMPEVLRLSAQLKIHETK